MPFYIASQVLGAFLAAIVCLFNYSHALTIYEGSPTIRTVPGTAAFITCYALDYVSNVNAFFDACIGPFIMMVAIFAVRTALFDVARCPGINEAAGSGSACIPVVSRKICVDPGIWARSGHRLTARFRHGA